jgi:hypothetical protein
MKNPCPTTGIPNTTFYFYLRIYKYAVPLPTIKDKNLRCSLTKYKIQQLSLKISNSILHCHCPSSVDQ